MSDGNVALGSGKPPLQISINGAHPTFRVETDVIAAKFLAPIEQLLHDLLEIACFVFAADSSVSRGGSTRSGMGEDWRRHFDFEIPVSDPVFWSQENRLDALRDAITFLTDDDVTFRFTNGSSAVPHQGFLAFDPNSSAFTADEVILFSGGLDSFAGALEALATRPGKVALVSHRSAQKVIPRQDALAHYLIDRFPGRVLHIPVRATRIGSEASESTQRSRSFLFATLGQIVAQMLGAKVLSFYENGVVSHNLPISPQVIGTMATRTTHPLSLTKLEALMRQIWTEAVPIHNPFQWLTKTEVVSRIGEHGAAEHIGEAVSCTSIREQDTLHTHCGECSQCLDRRFAVLAAGLEAYDPEEMYRTDVLFGPRLSDRSRTMAVDWTRHGVVMSGLSISQFMERFGQEMSRITLGHPDLTRRDALRRSYDLHQRQAAVVVSGLQRAIQSRAADLVLQVLSPHSLISMHISAIASETPLLWEIPATAPTREIALREPATASDWDENAPLEAAFWSDGAQYVVAVSGLGRVEGKPARVAHVLQPILELDRAAGKSRANHQFVSCGKISGDMAISKLAVAQNVTRCRRQLADFAKAILGRDPSRTLLIENKPQSGYRLDPDIRLIDPGQTGQ